MIIKQKDLRRLIRHYLNEATEHDISSEFKNYLEGIRDGQASHIKKGTTRHVIDLQNLLLAKGQSLPNHGADGKFGNETKTAVENYQVEKGLKKDGIVGPQTATALLDQTTASTSIDASNAQDRQKDLTPLSEGSGFMKVTPAMLTSAVSGISDDLATYALSSFREHYNAGEIKNNNKMLIVDYTIPGSDTRLWCVQINSSGNISVKVACNVAHGSGDPAGGSAASSKFSNTPKSLTSSVGAFVTTKRYNSSAGAIWKAHASSEEKKTLSKSQLKSKYKGPAMRIKGLDSTNSNDLKRYIVIHGATYQDSGKTGRSHGCLATSRKNNKKILDFLGVGTFGYKFGGKSNAASVDTSWVG